MKTLLTILIFLCASVAQAADVEMGWDEVTDATGYKIYMSTDQGASWDLGTDVGLAQQDPDNSQRRIYTYPNVPEDILILFMGSAYNANAETIKTWSGCWYNHLWRTP